MILGTDVNFVEELAGAIEQAGADFGMSLHWGKTQASTIGAVRRSNERPFGPLN